MKKYLKRFGSLFVAMTMMFAVNAIPAFAATPQSTDTVKVSVTNVEADATVTGYKIIDAEYGASGGLKGYKNVSGVEMTDMYNPTETEIAAIVKAINDGKSFETVNFDSTAAGYSADVTAGTYLVLVNDTSTTLYNPMLVSAGYDDTSTLTAGTVDAEGDFTTGGTTYYAKKSTPTVNKTIVGSGSGNDSGDDLAVGDEQNFKIETVIPDYSEAYKTATFKLTDTLSGLTYKEDSIVVTVGGAPVTDVVISASGSNISIDFKPDYVLKHGNETVVVTYTATLNEDAGVNYDANTNKVVLDYTNDPTSNSLGETDDITYHYTFGIDASLGGNETTKTQKTHELIKVKEDGSVTTEKVNDGIDEITVSNPLSDAVFTLTNKATNKQYTATSDTNGYLAFTGLDAGSYTLVETKAPDGYALNTTEHSVVIEAAYNTDGTLRAYSITIDGSATSTYSAVYEKPGVIETIQAEDQTVTLVNTKISALPSTGGIGTYIFTALGVFIMACALILLAIRRRRANNI